jgi:hypothetical protein
VRLDDLVEKGELQPPQFVKIDVEGHGHRAVDGMRSALASTRPAIVAAVHSPQELQGIMSTLTALGYDWREVSGSVQNPEVRIGADYIFTPSAL